MSNDKVINRLLKLLALAERGIGGEKDNAQRFLDKELQRHGLTIEDLRFDTSKIEKRLFEFESGYEEILLHHIFAHITNDPNLQLLTSSTRKGCVWIELSEVQFLDVELHYEVHKTLLNKTLKLANIAYITKNHLFPDDDAMERNREISKENQDQLSHDELLTIHLMMQNIEKTQVRKALNSDKR